MNHTIQVIFIPKCYIGHVQYFQNCVYQKIITFFKCERNWIQVRVIFLMESNQTLKFTLMCLGMGFIGYSGPVKDLVRYWFIWLRAKVLPFFWVHLCFTRLVAMVAVYGMAMLADRYTMIAMKYGTHIPVHKFESKCKPEHITVAGQHVSTLMLACSSKKLCFYVTPGCHSHVNMTLQPGAC